MIILVSNDDGIRAEGIKILSHRLADEAGYEIYVIAPEKEQSHVGYSITVGRPLRVKTTELGGKIKHAWEHDGTPVDGVAIAIKELMPCRPDLVVSGINSELNLGRSVNLSGTIAAARVAVNFGIPAIAASLEPGEPQRYEVAAEVVARLVNSLAKIQLDEVTLLNVNVPNLPLEEIKGVQVTGSCTRTINYTGFKKRADPQGWQYYWSVASSIEIAESENTDRWAIQNKFVAVSPLVSDMTDKTVLKKLPPLTIV